MEKETKHTPKMRLIKNALVLRAEIDRLKEENERLKKENKVIYGSEMVQLSDYQDLKKEREELKAEIKDLMDGQDQQAVDLVRLIEIIDRAYWHMKYNSPDKKTMAYNEWEACLKIMEPFKILDRLKK